MPATITIGYNNAALESTSSKLKAEVKIEIKMRNLYFLPTKKNQIDSANIPAQNVEYSFNPLEKGNITR